MTVPRRSRRGSDSGRRGLDRATDYATRTVTVLGSNRHRHGRWGGADDVTVRRAQADSDYSMALPLALPGLGGGGSLSGSEALPLTRRAGQPGPGPAAARAAQPE